MPRAAVLTVLLLGCAVLPSCRQADPPIQRVAFDELAGAEEPLLSPNTSGATWQVNPGGQAIDFGVAGAPPLLTLACRPVETPPVLRIVRHVVGRPGAKALFPVIGNGTISRFKLDATLAEGEWRWQGDLPASDPLLEVFTGPRELEATLPGGGTLLIAGSRIPGEFVIWCRAGGRARPVESAASAAPSSAPPAP
ncbi:MAG: hypothetical protein B7Z08_10955 [Sphingomonadales bacterium 32-68-7]|nr:MAG: hypothetical protein B7Z33_10900 [Sphingomonadales bacterium 12-68-11]OYX08088.1 MAG: hypothetical protein B7Z08_10955 [Sphingomonadales bacterium 32-68-7]